MTKGFNISTNVFSLLQKRISCLCKCISIFLILQKTCCMPPSVETKCTPSVETKCTPPAESKRSLLENYLTKLGISFRTMDHPAVFTVAAMMEHVSVMPGYHGKNLFVKDKKSSKLFLITTRHDAAVSLSSIAKKIGAKELRFADEEVLNWDIVSDEIRLWEMNEYVYLGARPVTGSHSRISHSFRPDEWYTTSSSLGFGPVSLWAKRRFSQLPPA